MKINNLIFILLLSVFWTGCTKEEPIEEPETGNGKTVEATFTFRPSVNDEISVKAVTGADENVIKDLWVLQFSTDGNTLYKEPQYITDFTVSGSDYTAIVQLLAQESRVCFVANTHNSTLYSSVTTEADMKGVTMAVANEANLISANGVPMSGTWAGTPNQVAIPISLNRSVTKLTLNLKGAIPSVDLFTLKYVTVKQVPKIIYCYQDPLALPTPAYPALSSGQTIDYPGEVLSGTLSSTVITKEWYLPENARGKGSATAQTNKTASTAPSGQGAYCTYIEIEGTYVLVNKSYNVKYRIFLGANNTSDYNILRNTNYTLNVTIKGMYTADARITATAL